MVVPLKLLWENCCREINMNACRPDRSHTDKCISMHRLARVNVMLLPQSLAGAQSVYAGTRTCWTTRFRGHELMHGPSWPFTHWHGIYHFTARYSTFISRLTYQSRRLNGMTDSRWCETQIQLDGQNLSCIPTQPNPIQLDGQHDHSFLILHYDYAVPPWLCFSKLEDPPPFDW